MPPMTQLTSTLFSLMLLFFDILMILDQSEQNLTGFLQTVKIRDEGRIVLLPPAVYWLR